MSEEARRLVDGLATAVGWNKHNATELLLAYIERIERERDEARTARVHRREGFQMSDLIEKEGVS